MSIFRSILILSFFNLLINCKTTEFLKKRFVDYNFTDEGFLTTDVVQVISKANFISETSSIENDRKVCLILAQRNAVKKILSIFLHIKFNLGTTSNLALNKTKFQTFIDDYPITFSEIDYLKAEINFLEWVNKAEIVIQDTRTQNECMVVVRINDKNLNKKIHNAKVNFYPKILTNTK